MPSLVGGEKDQHCRAGAVAWQLWLFRWREKQGPNRLCVHKLSHAKCIHGEMYQYVHSRTFLFVSLRVAWSCTSIGCEQHCY
jgi:hypothetical protein